MPLLPQPHPIRDHALALDGPLARHMGSGYSKGKGDLRGPRPRGLPLVEPRGAIACYPIPSHIPALEYWGRPMATSASKGGGRKERVTPPKPKLLSREAKKLRQGDPAAARILAEESIAVRQSVRRGKAKK